MWKFGEKEEKRSSNCWSLILEDQIGSRRNSPIPIMEDIWAKYWSEARNFSLKTHLEGSSERRCPLASRRCVFLAPKQVTSQRRDAAPFSGLYKTLLTSSFGQQSILQFISLVLSFLLIPHLYSSSSPATGHCCQRRRRLPATIFFFFLLFFPSFLLLFLLFTFFFFFF